MFKYNLLFHLFMQEIFNQAYTVCQALVDTEFWVVSDYICS